MFKKIIYTTLVIGALTTTCSFAQQITEPKIKVQNRSFAIIVDQQTYDACKNEILAYQASIEKDGLPTYIVVDNWKKPEDVKKQIEKLYTKNNLEGIVLIGDIPIPMVRKGQHLATAFKMNESLPIKDSSIPSDRYYDDFDLTFDFIEQDKKDSLLFYYNLGIGTANKIQSDIYSGRLKPIVGKDKYQQISQYLKKVVKAKEEKNNKVDNIIAYLGDGTLSNSLTAWSPELYRLEEQFPNVFKRSSQAQVFRFDTWEFPKNEIINQLKRNDLDIAFVHEHGMPERMYISGEFPTNNSEDHLEAIRRGLRTLAKRNAKSKEERTEFLKNYIQKYNLSESIIADFDSKDFKIQDSLRTSRQGINVEEVDGINPNVKFTIFDACYNGDFREDDYIAGRFIFSDGEAIAALANTVSILQDVNTPHLIGSLGMGASIGQWAQLNNVLESHIIGDPTFTFSKNSDIIAVEILKEKDNNKLINLLSKTNIAEARNLILTQLYRNNYKDLAQLIEQEYDQSKYSISRYTAIHLATLLGGDVQTRLLQKGSKDSDEFIRRHSLNVISTIGDPIFIPTLVDAYIANQHSARVLFSIKISLYSFDRDEIKKYADQAFEKAYFTNNAEQKEKFYNEQFQGFYNELEKAVFDEKSTFRKTAISSLKNVNYHPGINKFIQFIKNNNESTDLRIAMLQSLAWFGNSYKKEDIQKACEKIINNDAYPENLRIEAQRTLNTIK